MSNIYGTFVVRHISDYPNWGGWHYAMNANREILPRMFYHSMDTGWTDDGFDLEYYLDFVEQVTGEVFDSYKNLKDAVKKLIEICDNTEQQKVSEIWQQRIGVVKEVMTSLENPKQQSFYCADRKYGRICSEQCAYCVVRHER
jgi:uncharacterized protein YjbJ (UPF0337 family)